MPNPNYLKGVRLERAYAKELRDVYGCEVSRTRGSKGKFDLISVDSSGTVTFIQCKSTSDPSEARRLEAAFRKNPPYGYRPNANYHQQLVIKVDRQPRISVTV